MSITDAFISFGSAVAPAVKAVAVAIKEVMDKLKESKEFDRFMKNLEQVAKQLGKEMAEQLKKVNDAMERFNNLSDETQRKIIKWAVTLAPLTFGLGVLSGALSNILNLLSKLISGIKWLVEKIPVLIGLIKKLPLPVRVGGIFGGVVATVAELGDWVRSRQQPSRPEAIEQLRRRFETSPLLREALAGAERQTAEFARIGQKVMEEMTKGMRQGKEKPAKAMDEALQEVRKRLPKSPPEKGPLKDIVEAGIKIPQLIAEGIKKGGQKAVEAMEQLAGHLMGVWTGWLRRFALRGDIQVALARARGLPEEAILGVERASIVEQLTQTMRVLQRMRELRRKGVSIAEEEILEIEREAAELQARLREIAERQKELRYQRYLEEAEQAKIEEERQKLLERELAGLPQPTPIFPPLEPLGDVERMAFEEAKEYMREIEAISRAYQEMARVAPELEGLPIVPPSPVSPLPEMERATEDLRRELEERAKLLDKEAKLAELWAAIAKERNDPKAIQLELEAIEKRIEALRAYQKVVAMERDATEAIIKALEMEREIAELEVKSAKIRQTVPPFAEGMGKVTEDFLRRLPEVVGGRIKLQEAVKEFVRDIQEQIAGELLKPLTEAIRKAMGNLANQISAALAQVLAQLPQSIQLGLGGLALFGGLRPVTEAIEGVGKFITHTVGEVLKVFGIRIGGKKKASPPAVIPLGAAVYGPSINLSTAVTLQVDGRELGRVLVRQAV